MTPNLASVPGENLAVGVGFAARGDLLQRRWPRLFNLEIFVCEYMQPSALGVEPLGRPEQEVRIRGFPESLVDRRERLVE